MRTRALVPVLLGVLALAWIATSAAPQSAQSVPGIGSGVTTIAGTVNVGNTPAVTIANSPAVIATQAGEWKMAVTNQPQVIVALPAFVRAGVTYECMWPSGERELLKVGAVAAGGWIRIDGPPERWVNISLARSLQERK